MHEYLLLSHSRQGISSAHQLWTYLHFLTSVVVVWLRLQPASTMKAYDYTFVFQQIHFFTDTCCSLCAFSSTVFLRENTDRPSFAPALEKRETVAAPSLRPRGERVAEKRRREGPGPVDGCIARRLQSNTYLYAYLVHQFVQSLQIHFRLKNF